MMNITSPLHFTATNMLNWNKSSNPGYFDPSSISSTATQTHFSSNSASNSSNASNSSGAGTPHAVLNYLQMSPCGLFWEDQNGLSSSSWSSNVQNQALQSGRLGSTNNNNNNNMTQIINPSTFGNLSLDSGTTPNYTANLNSASNMSRSMPLSDIDPLFDLNNATANSHYINSSLECPPSTTLRIESKSKAPARDFSPSPLFFLNSENERKDSFYRYNNYDSGASPSSSQLQQQQLLQQQHQQHQQQQQLAFLDPPLPIIPRSAGMMNFQHFREDSPEAGRASRLSCSVSAPSLSSTASSSASPPMAAANAPLKGSPRDGSIRKIRHSTSRSRLNGSNVSPSSLLDLRKPDKQGFVNFDPMDAVLLMSAVAPSGSCKRRKGTAPGAKRSSRGNTSS